MRRQVMQLQIGSALRAARWSRGVTQHELSRLLGIDRSTFARYESGERPIPATVLLECARYLDLSIDYLLRQIAEDIGTSGDL